MQNRISPLFAVTLLLCLLPALSSAAILPYIQNFEGLNIADPDALGNDGWLVYGNVFAPDGTYLYGYGTFPAPNTGAAFCAIVAGQGGDEQGAQQMVAFSDYENGDHGNGNLIESNIFHEQVIGPEDLEGAWVFTFNAKLGNIEGSSTAAAFLKTLDPSAGYATTNFITVDMTTIPETWSGYTIYIMMDPSLEGQLLQFGFTNTATHYEGSGIFYDNVDFYFSDTIDVPVGSAAIGIDLRQNYPNPFNPQTKIDFVIDRSGAVNLSVFDLTGRKITTLQSGELEAGAHTVSWNGTNHNGHNVAAGQYWYQLTTPEGQVSRSMILLK